VTAEPQNHPEVRMDPEYAALASSAATAIVTAMAQDGWDGIRSALTGLWRRAHPEQAGHVEAALEQSRRELTGSEGPLTHVTETELAAEWQAKLRRLLAVHPEVGEELVAILDIERQRDAGVSFGPVTHHGSGSVYQAGRDISLRSPQQPDA
jgi:hypothetical protein